MQDSVDSKCDVPELRAMASALEKSRKTIMRQRGQLASLSQALMQERAENAKLQNELFKMELEMERQETEGERRHDDAATELEQYVALMTLDSTATRGRRCGRCGNRCGDRSAATANWRGRPPRRRGSSIGVDAPQGTNLHVAWHY